MVTGIGSIVVLPRILWMYVLAFWSVLLALGAKGTAAGAHGIGEKAGFASGRVSRRGRLLAGGVEASFVRRDLDMRGNRCGPGCLIRRMQGATLPALTIRCSNKEGPRVPEIQIAGNKQEHWHAQVNAEGQDWHYNSLLLAAGKLVTLHLPRGPLVPGRGSLVRQDSAAELGASSQLFRALTTQVFRALTRASISVMVCSTRIATKWQRIAAIPSLLPLSHSSGRPQATSASTEQLPGILPSSGRKGLSQVRGSTELPAMRDMGSGVTKASEVLLLLPLRGD